VVKALFYKPEDRGFETDKGKRQKAALAVGITQPLTVMSTRSRKIMFLGCKARPVRRADNLTVICEPIV
jgi:hypothetical protein